MTDSGLHVQLRSYVNFHFPIDAPTVVFVRDNEIQRVGIIDERRDIPDPETSGRNRRLVHTRTSVVLDLANDATPIADAIAREKQLRIGTTFRHYPFTFAHRGSCRSNGMSYLRREHSSRGLRREWRTQRPSERHVTTQRSRH